MQLVKCPAVTQGTAVLTQQRRHQTWREQSIVFVPSARVTLQNFSFLIHKMRIIPGVVLHACNLSTWGAEAREPSIPG